MPILEQSFTLDVPSSTENLAIIRDFVSRIAAQAGLTDSEVANLELAVDEACANVIEHAYGHDRTKQVVVKAAFDGDALRINVTDTGQGFDPSAIEEPELRELVEKRRSGGLGLRLIRSLMDEVHYDMEPGKRNELRMVKRLRR